MAARWTSAELVGFADAGERREIIDGEMSVSQQRHFYPQSLGDSQLVLVATRYTGDTLMSPLLPRFSQSLSKPFAEIPARATYADNGE